MQLAYPSAFVHSFDWNIEAKYDHNTIIGLHLYLFPGTLKFNPVNSAGDRGAIFFFKMWGMDCPLHDLLDLEIENHVPEHVEQVLFCNTEDENKLAIFLLAREGVDHITNDQEAFRDLARVSWKR